MPVQHSLFYASPVKYSPRIAIGYNKSGFAELGINRMRNYAGCTGWSFIVHYVAFDLTPKIFSPEPSQNLYGLKAGSEYIFSGLALGYEAKIITNGKGTYHVKLSPKAGLGLGFINLWYSLNIPIGRNDFPQTGLHQLSVAWNLDRLSFFKKQKK